MLLPDLEWAEMYTVAYILSHSNSVHETLQNSRLIFYDMDYFEFLNVKNLKL